MVEFEKAKAFAEKDLATYDTLPQEVRKVLQDSPYCEDMFYPSKAELEKLTGDELAQITKWRIDNFFAFAVAETYGFHHPQAHTKFYN